MAVLDTSFLIDIEREVAGAMEVIDALRAGNEPLRVPAAAWVEYLHVLLAPRRQSQQRVLDRMTSFEAFDRGIAERAVWIQGAMRDAGTPLGWHDVQIAATALHHGEPVVSSDDSFDRVPGLDRIGW